VKKGLLFTEPQLHYVIHGSLHSPFERDCRVHSRSRKRSN